MVGKNPTDDHFLTVCFLYSAGIHVGLGHPAIQIY
jgi:hypothetical protein